MQESRQLLIGALYASGAAAVRPAPLLSSVAVIAPVIAVSSASSSGTMRRMDANPPGWSLLKVQAVELIEYDSPGWVRVRLVDADGRPRVFEDKIPIFFHGDQPTPATTFPVPAHIRCQLLRAEMGRDGRETLIVSTAVDHVEDQDGLDEFRVRRDQVELSASPSPGS